MTEPTAITTTPAVHLTDPEEEETNTTTSKRCGCCSFDGLDMARGYNLLGTGRGPIVMSNIFLSTALIFLASDSVGCTEEVFRDDGTSYWQVKEEECNEQVYGAFKPSALITNIAVISGVLSALLMPVIGAIVDYTPRRWTVGAMSALLIILVQAAQIGTGENTWFAMSILQAITGFFYQVQVLATYAYLPDISRTVGEKKMTSFTSTFSMVQYGCQMLFLVLIIALDIVFSWNDVFTAQVSQAINTVTVSISFYLGWRLLPRVEARHVLPEGAYLLFQGFRQNWQTACRIQRDYKKGLRWYLLALIFAEATANAFTIVAVVFLADELKLTSSEVGIFFLIALFAMIPGGKIGSMITARTNPNTSWRLALLTMFGLGVVGGLALTEENAKTAGYAWGFAVGINLGWFYPTENLFFSMVIPRGQEAELAGIFVYCTQIIGWLPPLIFSIMVEQNIKQGYGVIAISAFALIAVALLSMASSWPEIVADVRKSDGDAVIPSKDDNNNGSTDEDEHPEETEKNSHAQMAVDVNSFDLEAEVRSEE